MQKDTPQIAVCIHPRYIEFGPTQPGGPREDKTLLTLPYCFVYRINYDSDIAILFLFTESFWLRFFKQPCNHAAELILASWTQLKRTPIRPLSCSKTDRKTCPAISIKESGLGIDKFQSPDDMPCPCHCPMASVIELLPLMKSKSATRLLNIQGSACFADAKYCWLFSCILNSCYVFTGR